MMMNQDQDAVFVAILTALMGNHNQLQWRWVIHCVYADWSDVQQRHWIWVAEGGVLAGAGTVALLPRVTTTRLCGPATLGNRHHSQSSHSTAVMAWSTQNWRYLVTLARSFHFTFDIYCVLAWLLTVVWFNLTAKYERCCELKCNVCNLDVVVWCVYVYLLKLCVVALHLIAIILRFALFAGFLLVCKVYELFSLMKLLRYVRIVISDQ